MTYTTAGFGLFCHKRIPGETITPEAAFEEKHGRPQVSFLMCGSKQKFHSLTFETAGRRHPGSPAILRSENHRFKSKELKHALKREANYSHLIHRNKIRVDTGTYGHRVECGRKNDDCINQDSPPTLYWSISRPRAPVGKDEDGDICCHLSSAESPTRRSSMLLENSLTFRKHVNSETGADWPGPKRRKLDSDVSDENDGRTSPLLTDRELVPISRCHARSVSFPDDKRQASRTLQADGNILSSTCEEGQGLHLRSGKEQEKESNTACAGCLLDANLAKEMGYPAVAIRIMNNSDEVDNMEVDNHRFQQSENQKEILHKGLHTLSMRTTSQPANVNLSSVQDEFINSKGSLDLLCRSSVNSTFICSTTDKSRGLSRYGSKKRGGKRLTNVCYEDERFPGSLLDKTVFCTGSGAAQKVKGKSGNCKLLVPKFSSLVWKKLETSDKFLLVTDRELRILYISGNVSRLLGHKQVSMLGQGAIDYIHPDDLHELKRLLKLDDQFQSERVNDEEVWNTSRTIYLAMRTGMEDSDRSCDRVSRYKKVQWKVKLQLKKRGQIVHIAKLVGLCTTMSSESMPVHYDGSISSSTCNMRLKSILPDSRIINLIGYESNDLNCWTTFHFHSPHDAAMCKLCYQSLISRRRRSRSSCSRFLSKSKTWVWMVTQAITVYDAKCNPQCIVCKDYVVRCKDSENILYRGKKSLTGKKYSGISSQTDTPKEINSAVSDHQTLIETDNDMILEELLCTDPVNFQAKISFVQQDRFIKPPNSCIYDSYDFRESVPEETFQQLKNRRLESSLSVANDDTMTVTNNLLVPLSKVASATTEHKSSHETKNYNFQKVNYVRKSNVVDISGIRNIDHLQDEAISKLKCHSFSLSPLQITDNNLCFNPTFVDSGISNHLSLVDIFQDLLQPESNEPLPDELCMTSKRQFSQEESVSYESPEYEAKENSISETCKCHQDSQSKKSLDIFSTQDHADNICYKKRFSLLDLSLNLGAPPHLSHEKNSSSSSARHQNRIQNGCHQGGNNNSSVTKTRATSKIASLLQMENMPNWSAVGNVKAGLSKNLCETSTNGNDIRKNGVILTSNGQSNERNLTLKKCSSEFNRKAPTVRDRLLTSVNSDLHVSLSANNESSSILPPLTSHLLLSQLQRPSLDYKSQSLATSSFSAINTSGKFQSVSLSLDPEATGSDFDSIINDTSSIITSQKSDPFLNEMLDAELTPQAVRDTVNDLASVTYSETQHLTLSPVSPLAPTIALEKHSILEQLDQIHSNSSHDFVDSSSEMTNLSLNELDSFLDDIPSNSSLGEHFNEMANMQSAAFTMESEYSHGSLLAVETTVMNAVRSSCTESGSKNDNETLARPSLLRTLLDKDGAAIQGPLTYTEWLLEQTLKKKHDVKKLKMPRNAGNFSRAGNRRIRGRKSTVIKSTELPLPKYPRRHIISIGRSSLQPRKPTKELPLPSLTIPASGESCMLTQRDSITTGIFEQNNSPGKENVNALEFNSPEISTEDFSLPEDLLDMAVEYCASLGTDLTEAFISDFSDSNSWEDNLYSLVGSPAEETKSLDSSSSTDSELLSEHISDQGIVPVTKPLSSCSISEDCKANHFPEDVDIRSALIHSPSISTALSPKPLLGSPHNHIRLENQAKISPYCHVQPSNGTNKMSLLRAAVTSPDVDKLIKQIPLRNLNKYNNSVKAKHGQSEDDSDVMITKTSGLQKTPSCPAGHIPHIRMFKTLASNTVKCSRAVSSLTPSSGSGIAMNDSANKQGALFDHFCMASLSAGPVSKGHHFPNSPPKATDLPSMTIRKTTLSSPTIQIKIYPGLTSETVGRSSESNVSQKRSMIPQSSPTSDLIPSQSRQGPVLNTDSSTTQPVSVMIMRKMNHRSRRSKCIAVQTENEPDEVYPEFERSPADKILYPSVIYSPSPLQMLSQCDTSLSSQSLPSVSCEVEKILQGFSGSDDSSSSTEESSSGKSNTPFLQKLLMGELSRDQYQRLDQQLLEREKMEASSS